MPNELSRPNRVGLAPAPGKLPGADANNGPRAVEPAHREDGHEARS